MKKIMIEAHKLTKKMVEKYGVDYRTQLGLCISYLLEEKNTKKEVRRTRNYGSFSRKQIGVIYAANKRNQLNVDSKFISTLYNYYTDLSGWQAQENYNRNSIVCDKVEDAIDAIFKNDYEEAQRCIEMAQNF